MKHILQIIILYTFIAILSLASCSDSEKRLSPLLNQTKVILDLGLPSAHAANDNTIWDKIRCMFIRDAMAQSAPATLSSILVRVSGPDIGVTEQTFLPYGTISLNVLSGSFRQFDVTAYVAAGNPSAALSFRGLAIANLPAGGTVNVPVYMTLNETKIVIPDGSNCLGNCPNYHRIIMIENISNAATTWIAKTTFPTFTGTLNPYDISFDSRGRIYIANNATPGIIRIDDINGTNLLQGSASRYGTVAGLPINNVLTIAVDRINNLLYFSTGPLLYRSNLDGSSPATQLNITIPGGDSIRGIDVDDAGMLYIVAAFISAGTDYLFKYNPNTQLQVGTPYSIGSGPANPCDVLVRSPYIYVANFTGITVNQILQLTFDGTSFNQVASNGNKSTSTTGQGYFFGASRFLAIRNDLFIVADSNQGGGGTDYDKIVSFSDMSFANWAPYGSYGGSIPGVGEFRLYSTC